MKRFAGMPLLFCAVTMASGSHLAKSAKDTNTASSLRSNSTARAHALGGGTGQRMAPCRAGDGRGACPTTWWSVTVRRTFPHEVLHVSRRGHDAPIQALAEAQGRPPHHALADRHLQHLLWLGPVGLLLERAYGVVLEGRIIQK